MTQFQNSTIYDCGNGKKFYLAASLHFVDLILIMLNFFIFLVQFQDWTPIPFFQHSDG